MKNTLITLIALVAFITNANAQNDNPVTPPLGKASFGIYGGINFQNINGKDANGDKLSNSLVTKFHIGVNEEIPIAPEFYCQVGLQFITKGTKGPIMYSDNTSTREITRSINMNYLEIPLNFVYKPLVGAGHFILGFGPYAGYCIGGKAMFTGTDPPADADLELGKNVSPNDGNNIRSFKPWDVGANFFTGYQFMSGFNILLNSQLGLININSNTSSKMENQNTGFGLSVGYRF